MAPVFDAGAVILAGGRSRRMGRDKCLLPYRGVPLIQHVTNQLDALVGEVVVSTNRPDALAFLGLRMVSDIRPDEGPLMGIASALRQANYTWNFITAVDLPEIPLPLVTALYQEIREGTRCVIPCEDGGRVQPLLGWYHRDLAAEILSMLARGERRVHAFAESIAACQVPIPGGTLANLNTLEDYAKATLERARD